MHCMRVGEGEGVSFVMHKQYALYCVCFIFTRFACESYTLIGIH